MRDPIDELVAEVARKRTSAETFSETARRVFLAALPDLEADTVDALERSGRAFVADVRSGGITMWRLTEEAPELSLPDTDDVEELVWIGFLAVAAGRVSPLHTRHRKRPDGSASTEHTLKRGPSMPASGALPLRNVVTSQPKAAPAASRGGL